MERQANTTLRVGAWRVNPAAGEISRNGQTAHLEARTMRLLLCLAQHAGEVVSIEELLNQVWSGVIVSQDSVYQAVASLRRLLGDDPRQPTYIATVPRLGYRMLAPVHPWTDDSVGGISHGASAARAPADSSPRSSAASISPTAADTQTKNNLVWRSPIVWAVGAALCLVLALALLPHNRGGNSNRAAQALQAAQPRESIAVLPFLDLTEGMKEEEFADGLSEEITDKLSKIPGFRVPAPSASFYFKYKQVPIAEIARSLGVVFVVDGSTRKSGGSMRIAARLVRAENGYVIWSETYDRLLSDRTVVQDEIASEITKALRASIEATPDH
jgi:transcriptional activator of cad operon